VFIWYDLFIAGNILSKKYDEIGELITKNFLKYLQKPPEVFIVYHITMFSDAQNNKVERLDGSKWRIRNDVEGSRPGLFGGTVVELPRADYEKQQNPLMIKAPPEYKPEALQREFWRFHWTAVSWDAVLDHRAKSSRVGCSTGSQG
jgi:hypothetical protein